MMLETDCLANLFWELTECPTLPDHRLDALRCLDVM